MSVVYDSQSHWWWRWCRGVQNHGIDFYSIMIRTSYKSVKRWQGKRSKLLQTRSRVVMHIIPMVCQQVKHLIFFSCRVHLSNEFHVTGFVILNFNDTLKENRDRISTGIHTTSHLCGKSWKSGRKANYFFRYKNMEFHFTCQNHRKVFV